MSISAMAWALKQNVGSPTRKLVLLAIANYADENGKCWPSQERLCQDTELGERTIRDALKGLEADGYITRTSRHVNGNKRQTDILQLVDGHRQELPVAPPANGSKSHRQMAPKPPAAPAGKPSIEPSEEEPSAFSAGAPKAKVIPFPNSESQSKAKGARIAADWKATPELTALALELGFSHEAAIRELANFHDYWLAASGSNAVKRDWIAAARVWLRKAASRFQNSRGPSAGGHGPSSGGRFGAMQRALARVAHSDPFSE